ncbi:hypothetical protein PRZ48_008046 [Zasmidium cellare]|uniref:Ubiquitin-like domain-containing protein n=1 Tax=Zasmidium cellare TaxID=395010 RepID=A0ABR0EFF6_ZASCE|nr:hypothetical protein PRZ48_008046 [Zasmidium cellare]
MSAKFTFELELTLQDIANIQSGTTTTPNAKRSIQAASGILVEAIKAMPYQISSKATDDHGDDAGGDGDDSSHPVPPVMTPAMAKTEADIIGGRSTVRIHVGSITVPAKFELKVPLSITIAQLRIFVGHRTGTPRKSQRILHDGMELRNRDWTLHDYDVQAEDMLEMHLELIGS